MQSRFFLLSTAAQALACEDPSLANERSLPSMFAYGHSNVWGFRAVAQGERPSKCPDEESWDDAIQRSLGRALRVPTNRLNSLAPSAELKSGVARLAGEDHNGDKRLAMTALCQVPLNLAVAICGANHFVRSVGKAPSANVASYISQAPLQLRNLRRFVYIGRTRATVSAHSRPYVI